MSDSCQEKADFKAFVYEDGSSTLHGRVAAQDRARTLLTAADFDSITYSVIKKDSGEIVVANVPVTPSTVISAEDSYGDNFHLEFPGNSFPDGSLNYVIDFTFNLVGGSVRKAKGIVYAIETGTGT